MHIFKTGECTSASICSIDIFISVTKQQSDSYLRCSTCYLFFYSFIFCICSSVSGFATARIKNSLAAGGYLALAKSYYPSHYSSESAALPCGFTVWLQFNQFLWHVHFVTPDIQFVITIKMNWLRHILIPHETICIAVVKKSESRWRKKCSFWSKRQSLSAFNNALHLYLSRTPSVKVCCCLVLRCDFECNHKMTPCLKGHYRLFLKVIKGSCSQSHRL